MAIANKKKIKVCYVAGREAGYSRTRMIIDSLQAAGYEVATCLPPDRSFRHYPNIIWQFLRKKRGCDLVVVGFYGQLLLPVVWLFTRKPILFDVYISTFGTMVHDRDKAKADSFLAKLFWLSDVVSMRLADRIIIESRHHIQEYARMFRANPRKFRQIFLATDPEVMRSKQGATGNGKFLVHFHGEYAPFHGVQYILQAADKVRHENVHFQIIGTGITYDRDRKLAADLKLENCTFIDRVPFDELADYMSRADCCLGFFGQNPRTMRVFTNKVVEALAVGKPLISTKNQPLQELLTDGESALLIEQGNPTEIAEAILRLRDEPELRRKIAQNGHELFLQNCTLKVFAEKIKNIIEEMLN
ncbi:MAG: glycosyltransferase [bacterium]